VSKEAAKEVILERLQCGPFMSLKDVVERTTLPRDALEALARAGAFDRLIDRREALFQIALLVNARVPNQSQLFAPMQSPPFPDLTMMEKVQWDYKTKGFTEREVHPVDLVRQNLLELGALPMSRLRYAEGFVRTGGLIVARQKPPTANGFAFFLLEDGVERVQVVISPDLWEQQRTTFRDAQMMITEGQLQREQKAWTLKAAKVWEVSSGVQ
jgi:error-prone DNA polymerase